MLHNRRALFFALLAFGLSSVVLPAAAMVVTSIKPLGFIAAAIADGVTPVEVLLPDGASEHEYTLRPSDAKRLQSADLVVWIGPEMEAFLTRPVKRYPSSKVVTLADLLTVKPLLITGNEEEDGDHGSGDKHRGETGEYHRHDQYNMHLWLSPEIARASAVAIHEKLLELMPKNRTKLDANLSRFMADLATADQNISDTLAPVKGRGYFVFHDAYRYFEKYYGLTPLGYFTINPEIQPGAQRLHQIRTQLVEQKAECVFAEPQFRPAVIDAVAQGTSVRKGTLDPLGIGISLSKDSYVTFLSRLSNEYVSCLKGDERKN